MDYKEFLEQKRKGVSDSGFDVSQDNLNSLLFPFQKHCVQTALRKGRYALFEDCGLGKSIQQLEWSSQIVSNMGRSVIIFAPLAVVGQTIQEALKFGYKITEIDNSVMDLPIGIYITNYDNLDNIDASLFGGVVLDESSILKNFDGKTKQKLVDKFYTTDFKLCCTATPSPNDVMELCNHAEFLNIMGRNEMLSMYFIHDGGETTKWRLKGHCEDIFWDFVSEWAMMLMKPSDIGFDDNGYNLPQLNIQQVVLTTPKRDNGKLFNDTSVSATDFNAELRETLELRLDKTADIVNSSDENFIIWIKQDVEGDYLRRLIPDAVEVRGSQSNDIKRSRLIGFANGEFRVLIVKPKIGQYGLNYQNCHNQIFASLDFSFEATYQGIRRSYRFGQKEDVNILLLVPDTLGNVLDSINRKQEQFNQMQIKMAQTTNKNINSNMKEKQQREDLKVNTEHATLVYGDCVEKIKELPSESVGLSIFSPPFASLYTYSDELEDMGNSKDYNEFLYAFKLMVKELYRIVQSGRNVVVHCMDLPIQKGKEGYIGLRDFSGMILDAFLECGFIYHSRVTIWKNPVTEMQRTKALGLLHKQVKKDSAMSRVGIPDYLLVFRKDGEHKNPIHCDISVDTWQKYASPVWMDIDYGNTLNVQSARDERDEKHICFATGTLVLTQRGYVPIESVLVGEDKTLTHLGNWKTIIAKKKTYENANVIKTIAQGVPNLISTPSHKLYAKMCDMPKAKKHISNVDAEWIEAKDTMGCYLNNKMPQIIESNISNDEWYIIGRYLADGHIDSRGHQFFVSIGNSKLNDFKKSYSQFIGHCSDKGSCTQIGLVNLSSECRDIMNRIGVGASNKVLPYECISLNESKSKSLMDGYLSGDGHTTKNNHTMAISTSRPLLLGMAMVIFNATHKICSIYEGRKPRKTTIQGRVVNCKQEWVLNFCNSYSFSTYDNDGIWKKVKKINTSENSDVWSIEVEDDHSYTAEGCIVKNCPLQLDTIERCIHLWSNPNDLVFTPFMGIGSEVYSAVKLGRNGYGIELKSSYFDVAVKNVKNIEFDRNQVTLF